MWTGLLLVEVWEWLFPNFAFQNVMLLRICLYIQRFCSLSDFPTVHFGTKCKPICQWYCKNKDVWLICFFRIFFASEIFLQDLEPIIDKHFTVTSGKDSKDFFLGINSDLMQISDLNILVKMWSSASCIEPCSKN